MADLLKSHPLVHVLDLEEVPMYILTNKYKTNGATVLLYEGMIEALAEYFHMDLIILPSSIHELILMPVENFDPEELQYYTQVVQEVNENQVADDEVLSDHAYFYNRKTHQFISNT